MKRKGLKYCILLLCVLFGYKSQAQAPPNCSQVLKHFVWTDTTTQILSSFPSRITGCRGSATGSMFVQYDLRIPLLQIPNYRVSLLGPTGLVGPNVNSGGFPAKFEFNDILEAGDYLAIIEDVVLGCSDTFELSNPTVPGPDEDLHIDTIVIDDASCGNNGRIQIFPDGGDTSLYRIRWIAFPPEVEDLILGFDPDDLIGGSYSAEITDAAGCTIDTLGIVLLQGDTFRIAAMADPTVIDLGETSQLSVEVIDVNFSSFDPINFLYQWDPDSRISDVFAANPIVQPCRDFTYNVIVREDSVNCSDTASVRIEVIGEFNPFVPNAFTPNGSGPIENETFRVFGVGIDSVGTRVWDRKGALIFESEENNQGWDGTIGGAAEANTGMYLYETTISSVCGESIVRRGEIMLIR